MNDMNPVTLFILAAFLAVAPWPMAPEPHLVEKIGWLQTGHPFRLIDWWDLFQHGGIPLITIGFGIRQTIRAKKGELTPPKDS